MPAVQSRGRADAARPKPRSDAYVGLLGLSLLALSAAILFAFLNWNLISEKPKPVQVAPVGGARTPPPPGGPAVNPPGVPGPPGAPPGGQPGGAPAPGQPGGNPPPPGAKAPPPAPPQKK